MKQNKTELSESTLIQCIRYALPNEDTQTITFNETLAGAINDIYRIQIGRKQYALRVRTREEAFGYEKGFSKEPIVGRFLTCASRHQTDGMQLLIDGIITDVQNKLTGGPISNPIGPDLIVYDHSCSRIPYIWSLQEWTSGKALDSIKNTEVYRRLGQLVGELHKPKFQSFLPSFSNSSWLSSKAWFDNIVSEVTSLSRSTGCEALPVLRRMSKIDEPPFFVLAHNDIQPLNVITSQSELNLIDWDNCQIAPPELDLVKLKYWTARDAHGVLAQERDLYSVFIDSYCQHSEHLLNQDIFSICEVLWLLRVFKFEQTREQEGRSEPHIFPISSFYRNILESL